MAKSQAPLQRQLITIGQAAEEYAVCTKTIRRRISDGSLTGYRMGSRLIRVDRNDLDALLSPMTTRDAGGR